MNGTVEPGPLIQNESMQPRKDATPVDEDAPRRAADRLARRIRAAEAGDHRAVRTLLAEVGPAVCRVVTFVLGPGHPDTADLIQDSLTEFLRALPPPEGAPQLDHLASSIALRRALEAAQWPALSVSAAPLGATRWFARLWRTSPQQMMTQRRRRLVAGALLSLSDEEAEVLGLRLLVGLTLPQIGALTGLAGAEVRSLLRSAKVVLGGAAANRGAIPLHPEALR